MRKLLISVGRFKHQKLKNKICTFQIKVLINRLERRFSFEFELYLLASFRYVCLLVKLNSPIVLFDDLNIF